MKFKGLVATLAAAVIAAPLVFAGAAQAADAPPKLSKEQFARGQKDGPAVIAASGIQCTPGEIVWLGSAKDPKTKVEMNAFETTCKEGLGYVINTGGAEKPSAYDCMALSTTPQVCKLPGNANPEKALAARAAAAGRQCDVSKAVYNGATPTGDTYYELACGSKSGFEMMTNGPKTVINECIMLVGSPRACKLTSAEVALTALQPAVQASGKTCNIKESRFIGASEDTSGDVFYEVGCEPGPGFVVVVDKNMAFRRAVDCKLAQGLAGGCKLTDISVTASSDAATYTKLAEKAGFPCQVSKYRLIGVDKQDREVVELACSNRPDGAVALFAEKGKSDVYDCLRAGALGQDCKLTSTKVLFDRYSQALAAKGKGTCKVSDARYLGSNSSGDFIETACSDGLPGWVVSFTPKTDTVAELLSCRQAAGAGVPCKLPGNTTGG
jgi:hypothetical protein